MNNSLYIYRSMIFDGKIHIKIVGGKKVSSAQCKLFRNGLSYAHISVRGDTGVFRYIPKGTYRSTAEVTLVDGSRVTLRSTDIVIATEATRPTTVQLAAFIPQPDTEVHLYENVGAYYLEVSVADDQAERLREDVHALLQTHCHIEAFSMEINTAEHDSVIAGYMPQTCKISAHIPTEKLADIATRINALDYVAYCVVTPDTTTMSPPPPPDGSPFLDADQTLSDTITDIDTDRETDVTEDVTTDVTPDFSHRQGYLDAGAGMNVRAAWARGVTGKGATVRHLDFGIYRRHEDLQGDVTVVNSRRESMDCNHGTASAGCVVATENGSGVTGVAHGCRFYFYEIDDLDLIVREASAGDIVSLDIHFGGRGSWLPALAIYSWWVNIRALTAKGVIVIMAAGNGGNFIGPSSGRMRDHGESGGILVGAGYSYNGTRLGFSNHGHRANLINSWGDNVASTGYGNLQSRPGNNRNYTSDYAGTSSATPLCAGALALIQAYAITTHGVFLNAREMTDLIARTGSTEGLAEGIGHRPNVDKAIAQLANQLS